MEPWIPLLPTLDLWLNVKPHELHRVSRLIPTLDWEGTLLGLRLRLQPANIQALYKEFIEATADADAMKLAAQTAQAENSENVDTQVFQS